MDQYFKIVNNSSNRPLLLICDHASNYIPPTYQKLGLTADQLKEHIAWDIGAAEITLQISEILNSVAILSGISRLIVDANRDPSDQKSAPEISDNITITGNKDLTKINRENRLKKYFWPYHNAIKKQIDYFEEKLDPYNNIPIIFSIHTFTQVMRLVDAKKRPWDVGVLWNRDPRVADILIRELTKHKDNLIVGDNQPYSGKEFYYTLDYHAGGRGIPHCAIEIRQDLVNTPEGINYWATLISKILNNILDNSKIHKIVQF